MKDKTMENTDIICIGESLTELSADESLAYAETLHKYFGGDTMTTAVSAAKLGAKVGYITVIGNDYLKDFLMASSQLPVRLELLDPEE